MTASPLEPIDQAIARELNANGRCSFTDLAERLVIAVKYLPGGAGRVAKLISNLSREIGAGYIIYERMNRQWDRSSGSQESRRCRLGKLARSVIAFATSSLALGLSAHAAPLSWQDAVTEATFLAGALNLPRLQGERFPVGPREIGIYLTADARDHLPALARMRDTLAAAGAPDLTSPTQPTTENP